MVHKKKNAEEIEFENLAMPEIHTHKCHEEEEEKKPCFLDSLLQAGCAIPEVHIRKKKK